MFPSCIHHTFQTVNIHLFSNPTVQYHVDDIQPSYPKNSIINYKYIIEAIKL
jgi:hypothetical protein